MPSGENRAAVPANSGCVVCPGARSMLEPNRGDPKAILGPGPAGRAMRERDEWASLSETFLDRGWNDIERADRRTADAQRASTRRRSQSCIGSTRTKRVDGGDRTGDPVKPLCCFHGGTGFLRRNPMQQCGRRPAGKSSAPVAMTALDVVNRAMPFSTPSRVCCGRLSPEKNRPREKIAEVPESTCSCKRSSRHSRRSGPRARDPVRVPNQASCAAPPEWR